MGQTHVHKYMPRLLSFIEEGRIDATGIITHRAALEDAPELYRTFRDKHDACLKVVLTPGAPSARATRVDAAAAEPVTLEGDLP